jgi:hypothetical protein
LEGNLEKMVNELRGAGVSTVVSSIVFVLDICLSRWLSGCAVAVELDTLEGADASFSRSSRRLFPISILSSLLES